jgi:hypothetical protein
MHIIEWDKYTVRTALGNATIGQLLDRRRQQRQQQMLWQRRRMIRASDDALCLSSNFSS